MRASRLLSLTAAALLLALGVGPVAAQAPIKVGDIVHATLLDRMVIGVAKPGAVREGHDVAIARAPKGAMPAAIIGETTTLKVKIESIDTASRIATMRTADGRLITHKVAADVDLSDAKVGDDVAFSNSWAASPGATFSTRAIGAA